MANQGFSLLALNTKSIGIGNKKKFKIKKLCGPFLWMGFNCLKASEPLRGGSLLFTTKSPSILSFPKKLLLAIFQFSRIDSKFCCDVFRDLVRFLYILKNVKNTHGGVLLLVKIKAFSL